MAAERIDVLAVMDAEIAEVQKKYRAAINSPRIVPIAHRLQWLLDARAAVAELIEADKEYDEARAEFYAVAMARETANERYMRQGRYITAGKRRAAALARMGEGA